MKTISAIVVLAVLGCANQQPQSEERKMSQNSELPADSDDESTIEMLSLTMAIPIDEMPQFLQERIKRTPPTFTLDDLRALDPDERAKVLVAVDQARAHHRAEARRQRNSSSPAERTAEHLAAFLEAARK